MGSNAQLEGVVAGKKRSRGGKIGNLSPIDVEGKLGTIVGRRIMGPSAEDGAGANFIPVVADTDEGPDRIVVVILEPELPVAHDQPEVILSNLRPDGQGQRAGESQPAPICAGRLARPDGERPTELPGNEASPVGRADGEGVVVPGKIRYLGPVLLLEEIPGRKARRGSQGRMLEEGITDLRSGNGTRLGGPLVDLDGYAGRMG